MEGCGRQRLELVVEGEAGARADGRRRRAYRDIFTAYPVSGAGMAQFLSFSTKLERNDNPKQYQSPVDKHAANGQYLHAFC